jgi:hypothetical protein
MSLLERFRVWFLKRYVLDDPATCTHERVVYCVALNDHCLELHCNNCALTSAVFNPTNEEWRRGLAAPSDPFI